jgi:DNA-binding response OmpR family regulator
MNKTSILLIEDEPALSQLIQEIFNSRGFRVTCATNGIQGWSLYKSTRPDIIIVDIMLPEKDGLTLVKDIRNSGDEVPILFLTARTTPADVIQGLEAGADDYVKKPFSIEELLLRIKNLTKRVSKTMQRDLLYNVPIEKIGNYLYNHKRLELTIEDHTTRLSQREGDLLQLLLKHRNGVLDRTEALNQIWGDDTFFNSRSMDVYITRLRKCLNRDPRLQIVNVRARGYRLLD